MYCMLYCVVQDGEGFKDGDNLIGYICGFI